MVRLIIGDVAPDMRSMKHQLRLAIGSILLAGIASAAGMLPLERAFDAMSMQGVWCSKGVYYSLYGDRELVTYLAGIRPDFIVLPVYSASPVHFRRGQFVFISTGL